MNKTYVCADIHSHLGVLNTALESLDDTDKLFVIGDAVDKGPDGIKVLMKIMEDPRCEMIIGNHDLLMLQVLASAEKDPENCMASSAACNWIFNGGMPTYLDFQQLPEEKQNEIYKYLKSLPLVRHITVNGRCFVLVHAGLPGDIDTGEDVYLDAIEDPEQPGTYQWQTDYVWKRKMTYLPEDVAVITGHTFVQKYGYNKVICCKNWFDIDCGLAMRDSFHSSLAVMCLDDMTVRYYRPETL